MKRIGQFIRSDIYTSSQSKGRFSRVCLQINICKPVRGSIKVFSLVVNYFCEFILSYEGLHEICALCGRDDHAMEYYPNINLRRSLDIIVERFGAHSFACNRPNQHPAHLEDSEGCWIKVAPKKSTSFLPWVEVRQEVPLSENPLSILSKSLKQLKQNAVTLQDKREFCMRPMNLWSRHLPKRCHYVTSLRL